jgi:hypothetical protein
VLVLTNIRARCPTGGAESGEHLAPKLTSEISVALSLGLAGPMSRLGEVALVLMKLVRSTGMSW